MIFNSITKKGVFFRKDAFFIGLVLLWGMVWGAFADGSVATAGCSAPTIDEYVQVRTVIDGDTIRLSNGTSVRLIGINTPEMGYDGAISQPLARAARQFLEAEIRQHQRIGLVYGEDRQDRHGRQLAHVFVSDNGTAQNVQQLLLEQGLAFWVAVAPNTRFLPCYRAAEAKAVTAQTGVWSEAYYQPKNAADEQALAPGFQLLRGTIVAVFETKNYFWLKFNDTVALRIAPKDMHNFQRSELVALKGKTVTARGWMFKHKNRLTMQISHPAAIAVD